MVHCIYQGVKGSNLIKKVFFSLKVFVLANSVDPDEMLHYAAFHLGLHYFPKCTFRSHLYIYIIQWDKRLDFPLV